MTGVLAVVAVLIGAGTSTAAVPTAITGPVTAFGSTTATVSGTVSPGGQSTSWHVEYGTTTTYGSQTANMSAGAGTANVAVSGSLANLAPGTTYHYRVVATNAAGTSRGADGVFTTTALPAVVTGAATGVTVSAATLTGTVDPNGRATTWWFEYGTSTSYGSRTTARNAGSGGGAAGVSEAISGLTAGRTYHYRLVAQSDAGTSRGADRTFLTSGVPGAVTDAATSIAPTSARLNGTVTPNGLATSWWFEYGTTTRYGSRTAVRNAGSGTGAVRVAGAISRLARTTTYHYRLVARNAAGTTVGADRAFSTSLAPGLATGPAQDVGPSTATLTGTVDPRGRATSWWFEYGTTTRYGARTSSRSAGSGVVGRAVSAAITRLAPNTLYHYRLVARNDAGTSLGADLTFTTTGVTLVVTAPRVVFGRGITLSGTIPTRRSGETVTLFAQPFGGGSPRSIATVLTGPDGSWRYLAKPRILTAYSASWSGGQSPAVTVAVRPAVALRRTATGRLSTRVAGVRSFAGRVVQLQRRNAAGRWITLKRLRLNGRSAALFRVATLPRGASTVRVAISVNQAGSGYLAGFSRTIVVRRS